MSQLTYNEVQLPKSEGMIAEGRGECYIKSGIANAAIPPGRFVVVETSGDTPIVRLPVLTGEVTGDLAFGFALTDPTKPMANASAPTASNYAQYDQVPVLHQGSVYLLAEDAVATYGKPVFVRFTDGGGALTIGRVRTDADGGEAVALPGAYFAGTCGAGELVKVVFNLQQ